MIIIYLLISTATVFIGAAIAFIPRGKTKLFSVSFGFTAGAVLGVLLLLVLHLYEALGILPLVVMWGGFLLIFLVERLTHAHPASTQHLWGADVALIGLSIHSLTDGFNLVVATKSDSLGTGLAIAILAHRLPVVTTLTLAFLKNSSRVATFARLSPLAVAPIIGALIGEGIVTGRFSEFTEYLTAFAGGTLMHVLIHDVKGDYTPNRAGKLAGAVAFAVGFAAIFLVAHNGNLWHAQ